MKRFVTIALTTATLGLMSATASAGSLNGTKWQTIDDKTGKAKSVIQFSEKGGKVSGKIVKLYNKPASTVCNKCKGSKKGKKIVGMTILSGLKAKGKNKWEGGKLLNPEDGKTYKGSLTLNGNKLSVKGCVVWPACRSQTWKRVK